MGISIPAYLYTDITQEDGNKNHIFKMVLRACHARFKNNLQYTSNIGSRGSHRGEHHLIVLILNTILHLQFTRYK